MCQSFKNKYIQFQQVFFIIIKIPDFDKNTRVPAGTLSIPGCFYDMQIYCLSFDQVQKAKHGVTLEGFVPFLSELPQLGEAHLGVLQPCNWQHLRELWGR